MKATGIVRRVDDLGRIVIPKEIRKIVDIREGETMEIFVTDEGGVYLCKEGATTTPDIFKEMNLAAVPAQPTVKAENRKQVVIHDKDDNEHHYVLLTEDQMRLLDWLENEYIFDNDRYEWETVYDHEFEKI